MKDDVLSVKNVVERVLLRDERARDSDKWLILVVLRDMGFHIYIPYNELARMPSFESIRRTRQKLQADGKYPPIDETKKKRELEEEEMEYINTWFDTR